MLNANGFPVDLQAEIFAKSLEADDTQGITMQFEITECIAPDRLKGYLDDAAYCAAWGDRYRLKTT